MFERRTTTFGLIILLISFGWGCSSVSPKLQDEYIRPGLGQGMYGVLDKYRQRIPEIMAKDKIPGLSIALVDREGILWTAGLGRKGDWGQPVTPDTLFSIGANTKTFTATGGIKETIGNNGSQSRIYSQENNDRKVNLKGL